VIIVAMSDLSKTLEQKQLNKHASYFSRLRGKPFWYWKEVQHKQAYDKTQQSRRRRRSIKVKNVLHLSPSGPFVFSIFLVKLFPRF
jgi:hypothetical protein